MRDLYRKCKKPKTKSQTGRSAQSDFGSQPADDAASSICGSSVADGLVGPRERDLDAGARDSDIFGSLDSDIGLGLSDVDVEAEPEESDPDPGDDDGSDEEDGSDDGLANQAKNWSRGKKHGAFVSLGKAKAAAARAQLLLELHANGQQDIARVVFSTYGRGRNAANARHVYHSHSHSGQDFLFSPFVGNHHQNHHRCLPCPKSTNR